VRQDEVTAILSRSFGAVAGEYDRLRPGPSNEALEWLLPRAATDVLELGAGTGILTRLLAERVPHVVAVEPDERMRAVLSERATGVEVLAGSAEQIPAGDESVDAVFAASAWHWVEEEKAVPEVARVLRPGGRFVFSVNVPEPAWGKIALYGVPAFFTSRKPLRFFRNSMRMLRYGRWLKEEARLGRFHYLPASTITEKLTKLGFGAVQSRLSFVRQAYIFRGWKPAGVARGNETPLSLAPMQK